MRKTCPRCGSGIRAMPCPVFVAGKLGNYTCRDAWHMPALSEEAESALETMAQVDVMFSGDMRVDAATLEYNPHRQSTAGYP